MRSFSLLALAAFLPALIAPRAAAQPGPAGAPFDLIRDRLGDAVEPGEQAYFGLFPTVTRARFVSARFGAVPGGGLVLTVRSRRGTAEADAAETAEAEADTAFALDALTAAQLARYVDGYEAIRWPAGPAEALRADVSALVAARLVRPNRIPVDARPFLVRRTDGSEVAGTLLYADETRLVLWPLGVPYAWRALDARAVVVYGSDVASVRVRGLSRGFLSALEGAAAVPVQVLGTLAAQQADGAGSLAIAGGSAVGAGAFAYLLTRSPNAEAAVGGHGPSFRAVARRYGPRGAFATTPPPEFAGWLATRTMPAERAFAAQAPRAPLRRLHVTAGALFNATPASRLEQRYAFVIRNPGGTFPPITYRIPAPDAPLALDADATFQLTRALAVGGEAFRFATRSDTAGAYRLRRAGGALFAAVTLGDGGPRSARSTLTLGAGAAYVALSARGAFDLIFPTTREPLGEPGTRVEYETEQNALHPYARAGYDFYFSPRTSLFAKVIYLPGQRLNFERQVLAFSGAGNDFSGEQPAYALKFSPVHTSIGVRLHL